MKAERHIAIESKPTKERGREFAALCSDTIRGTLVIDVCDVTCQDCKEKLAKLGIKY